MSQFEFVSVALALVYSFAAARLLGAAPWVFVADRRYWVHSVWFVVVLVALIMTWWQVWSLREVSWNAVRFIWAIAIPSLIYVRAGALVSQEPSVQTSWRDHFYRSRLSFFGIGIAIMVNSALVPWVMGIVPWFTLAPIHLAVGLLLVLYVVASWTDRPAVQGAIAVTNLVLLVASLVAIAWAEARAV